MEIVDYQTIGANLEDQEDFDCAIRREIIQGWQPYGSPYTDGNWMYQAMVKYLPNG